MQFDQSTKLGFLTSTSLAALVAMGIGQQAMAACTEMGMGPITTTCIGVIDTGYSESAAANTTNVTVSAGATVNNEAMGMIAINLSMNQDSVTNYGTIGKSPKTKTAIQMLGGSLLENGAAGVIEAENLGLFVSGSASLTVKNDGKITAGTAISIAFTSAATIENGTNGVITANNIAGSAIFMNSAAGQTLKITNRGTITGGAMGAAISSQAGNDEVINFGTINGLISLGDGTNKIDNASTGSRIDGRITLGSGTDTVNNNGTIIGQIDMGNGINTLTNGGSIFAGVRGGTGDDTITNNNLIQGSIDLGAATTKNILTNNGTGMSGITGDILGGVNVDEITNNGNIGGSINLSGGDDKLTNTGAILQNVDLGLGNDTMDNTGAVGGNVNLGDGTNTLTNNASGGIVGNITGGTGVDTLTTRGSIAGNINLGAGNDVMIWHIGGTVNGAIDGGAIDNDTLNLTGSGGATRVINNAITNFENLRVDAGISDVWVFNNNYTFSTKTDVVDGQLRIAAGRTLTTPNVTLNGVVAGRARLSGEGTIAGNLLVTKGIVIAGNETTGTGTLTVSGNYTNIADSILDISVGPGAQQTKLAVGGNITLDGTLRLSLQLGLVKGNATYDIITYGGMRTGQFATTNLPAGNRFTQYRVDYTSKANAVQVMVNKTNYNTVGKTYNQREAGDGLYRGMEGSVAGSDMEAVAGAFEGLPNDEAMQRALDSLSGVEWASMGEVRGGVSRSFRDAGMGRVGVMSEGMGVWGQLLQGRNDVDGDGNGAGIKGEVQGLVGGMEYGFGVGKVGVMVGYGDGKMRLSGMGEGKVEMMMGGVYGGWSFGGIEVEGGLSYGEGKQRVERQIGVGGVQRRVEGGEKVREFGGNVGIGYGIKLGMIEITPSLGFEVVRYEEKGFKENGGGDVGLVGGKERGWRGQGEVGVKVGGVFQAGAVTFSPYVHGGYERVVMGKGYMDRDVAFVGNENGTGFNVRGTDGGKEQFKAGAGINVGFGPVVLELGYEQSVGGKRDNQMFQGGLSVRW